MQAQRIPENDPEYIKTRNTVFAIQRHMEASRMKLGSLQQQSEQQAQQRQQRQQQPQAVSNGVNGELVLG